jgi:hypothetical protein
MIVHFIIAGVMASKGKPVSNVNGNANLTWEIKGSAGMAVIAFSYIFTGIYGLTWVCHSFLDYKSLLTATGSHCVDLCSRGLPTEVPSQGRRYLSCNQLDLQLCPCILRGTSLPQHPVEDLHHFRSFLYSHDVPRVLHVP